MAQELINLGALADDGTGDTIRLAGIKINNNFTELYAMPFAQTQLGIIQNNISTTQSNADLVIKPAGTGAVVFPGITIDDNNIKASRTNDDLKIIPNGSGSVVIDGIGFAGTSISATDSSSVNINENLIVDGTLTTTGNVTVSGTVGGSAGSDIGNLTLANGSITDSSGAISFGNENVTTTGTLSAETGSVIGNITFADGSITDSSGEISFGDENVTTTGTLDVSGLTTIGSMTTVSGASSFVGTITVDNLTFNDNIIASSSNADINLTPGGTGVVNVSNLTIDSDINLTDNVIKLTRSNDDWVLAGNGTGSVAVSNIDMNNGTVDNTVIGATAPAAGTFTTVSINNPVVTADGVTITDNTITANRSNDDLQFKANGTGYVSINGVKLPNADGQNGQVLRTDGSMQLSWFTSPILFDVSLIDDGTATITGDSSTQTIDSFSASTYRSAKYHVQISDTTDDRYTLMEANVSHDGSTAYISTFGAASNGDGDGSTIYDSVDLSADINGGNVRLRGTVNNDNNQVIKFVRRPVKV